MGREGGRRPLPPISLPHPLPPPRCVGRRAASLEEKLSPSSRMKTQRGATRRSLADQTWGWGCGGEGVGGVGPSGAGVGGSGGAEVSSDEDPELRESKIFACIDATGLQNPPKNDSGFTVMISCEDGLRGLLSLT